MTGLLTIEGEENAQNPIISTLRLDDCTSHYSSQPILLDRVWPILKILVVSWYWLNQNSKTFLKYHFLHGPKEHL